jgi:ABC-type transporter Mla subunit MlaD
LHANLNFLKTNVNELITSHSDQSKIIVDEIDSNLKEHNMMSNKMLTKIQAFETNAKKSTNECADYMRAYKLSTENWSAEHLKSLDDLLSMVAAKEASHQKEIQVLTAAIQADEKKRAEQLHAHQQKLANQLTCNVENTQKFVDQHIHCLTNLSSEIRQVIATSTEQLTSTIAVEKSNRQKQKSQIGELQQMLAQLSTTIAENDVNEAEMEKIVSTLSGTEAFVENGFTNEINQYLNHHNQTSADLKECHAQTEASQVMNTTAVKARNEQINRVTEVTDLNCEQVCGMVTKAKENLAVFGANQTEKLEKLSSDVSECTAQAIDRLSENQRELADIVGADKEQLNNEMLNTICLSEQLQRVVRNYENTIKEKLFETEERMEAFHRKEVVIYSSSGK